LVAKAQTHHLDNNAAELIAAGAGDADDLMTTAQVAAWLGVSMIWLHIGRMRGYGPPFVRMGPRLIRYKRSDVLEWLAERAYRSTGEYARRGRNRSRVGRKKINRGGSALNAT
jgi:predicted DNA-binding transcriptional regulator AlpA